jgi:hypothetical protein
MLLIYHQPLRTRKAPFDHPDWIFELKYHGFRGLACIETVAVVSSPATDISFPRSQTLRGQSRLLSLAKQSSMVSLFDAITGIQFRVGSIGLRRAVASWRGLSQALRRGTTTAVTELWAVVMSVD